jgi:hypothetical protein
MQRVLKIGAIKYRLRFLKTVLDEKGKEILGDVNFQKAEIRISRNQSGQAENKVVWHEVLHVVLDLCGIPASESTTDKLADTLIQVLADNPSLRANGKDADVPW